MGEVIKELRKRAKMTQHELAELIGVKNTTISQHETGKKKD